MTTQTNIEYLVERTMNHANWTGLTLSQLLEAGRIGGESSELLQWVKAANGSAKSIQHLRDYQAAASLIVNQLNHNH